MPQLSSLLEGQLGIRDRLVSQRPSLICGKGGILTFLPKSQCQQWVEAEYRSIEGEWVPGKLPTDFPRLAASDPKLG